MEIKSRQEIRNEIDMLQGNINRMCVTNDITELGTHFTVAKQRIDEILKYNMKRILKQQEQDKGD